MKNILLTTMIPFSERHGFQQKKMVQIENIDKDLRVGIWNSFYTFYIENDPDFDFEDEAIFHYSRRGLFDSIWCDFLKRPINNNRTEPLLFSVLLQKIFFEESGDVYHRDYVWPWWKVYNFLEFISANDLNLNRKKGFQEECNLVLEKESSAYRFIDGVIGTITSKVEIDEIEIAIKNSTKEVQNHLEQSLILLSRKEDPDFRNSVKESISALNAQCQLIIKDPSATLTKALEKIEREKKVHIHKHLNDGFQKIYSWTNDDGGIRHPLKDDPNVDREDAQFMLIACSAFINYLRVKKMKSEI